MVDLNPDIYSSGEALPLVAGSLYGSRTFKVLPNGKLGAVSWDYEWEPGENVATCMTELQSRNRVSMILGQMMSTAGIDTTPSNHDISTCYSHGFYAYTDGSNDWHNEILDYIPGVIMGYGKTHVGSKGFRSEKGKIIGLVVPDPEPETSLWKRFLKLGNDMSFSMKFGTLMAYLVLWIVGFNLVLQANDLALNVVGGFMCILSLFVFWFHLGTANYRNEATEAYFKKSTGMTHKEAYAKIRANYPDVKYFNTYEEMLDHFNFPKKETT